jgi:hypothetical protein
VFGYEAGHNHATILDVYDVPTKGEDTAKRIDSCAFGNWIDRMEPDICYCEAANTMPAPADANGFRRGMGIASAGRYMRAAGALEATIDMCGVEIVMVQPVTWKRALGLIGENKNGSLELIRGLYPDCADKWFKRKKDHNRADSALIAIYGATRCELITLQAA